jgi:hypothetical protein
MQHFQNIVNTIHQPSNADPSMKTLAQWFVEEGISQGISQGISKGRMEGRIISLQEITGNIYINPDNIDSCPMDQLKETLKRLEADFAKQKG